MNKLFILIPLFLFASLLQAQTDDHINWASFRVQKKIKSTTLAITPIVRINENISNYQNSSIDFSGQQKLGKGWSVMVLSRTWFIPDGDNRQFLWLDVAKGKSFENFKIGTRLRMHYAIDVFDNDDPDYLRWRTTFTFLKINKFSPFIAIEPWFRLNKQNEIQRIRYEPGFKYKISKKLDFLAILQREESINLEPERKVNLYITSLIYTL